MRIHLATLIVITNVSGALLWAHMQPHHDTADYFYGFPRPAFTPWLKDGEISEVYSEYAALAGWGGTPAELRFEKMEWTILLWPFFLNTVFTAAVIALAAMICESLMRRNRSKLAAPF